MCNKTDNNIVLICVRRGYSIYDRKRLFSKGTASSSKLGSIIYWNDKSHVALVTYKDSNNTIKYTQHSSSTQSTVYKVYSSSMNVKFYNWSNGFMNFGKSPTCIPLVMLILLLIRCLRCSKNLCRNHCATNLFRTEDFQLNILNRNG